MGINDDDSQNMLTIQCEMHANEQTITKNKKSGNKYVIYFLWTIKMFQRANSISDPLGKTRERVKEWQRLAHETPKQRDTEQDKKSAVLIRCCFKL